MLENSVFKDIFYQVYKYEFLEKTYRENGKGPGDKFALRFMIDNAGVIKKKGQPKKRFNILITSADGYMNAEMQGCIFL